MKKSVCVLTILTLVVVTGCADLDPQPERARARIDQMTQPTNEMNGMPSMNAPRQQADEIADRANDAIDDTRRSVDQTKEDLLEEDESE
jgi:hypothetical protein